MKGGVLREQSEQGHGKVMTKVTEMEMCECVREY